ncbi:MAG: transglutaminase domain-containing protein [Alkaliphilus sp.]
MTKKRIFKSIISFMIAVAIFAGSTQTIFATNYKVSFENGITEISAPFRDMQAKNGVMNIAGKSNAEEIWVALRGPDKEVVVHSIEVNKGSFTEEITLRFGAGTYTVWVSNEARKFDGSIRFRVVNEIVEDTRYSTASEYVDSDSEAIIELVNELISENMTEMEKLETIHEWVINNIDYNYEAFTNGDFTMTTASQTLENGYGMCREYSFLMAALARAAGLNARVVYGDTRITNSWEAHKHAWNEIMVDGSWITVDATWNAGYIQNGEFVSAPINSFFNPDVDFFARTHTVASITVH